MKNIHISKADPIGRGEKVEGVCIRISRDLPNRRDQATLKEAGELYMREATAFEQALHDTLPGGLYCGLISKMLERRACHFRVPFATFKPATKAKGKASR